MLMLILSSVDAAAAYVHVDMGLVRLGFAAAACINFYLGTAAYCWCFFFRLILLY